jgi:transcription termination/antitermination protein NusG
LLGVFGIFSVLEANVTETATATATVQATKESRSRWYILQAYSGFEKKVAQTIREDAVKQGVSDLIEEVIVPTEDVLEMRRGKKVSMERKFFPGYILVKMVMNDTTWQLVKTIPKVNGFLGGGGNRPQPITQREVDRIVAQVSAGVDKPKDRVLFDVGEQVKVVDGPFESFVGVIDEVDSDKERVKLSVTIFGRPTPVDLQFSQIERVS